MISSAFQAWDMRPKTRDPKACERNKTDILNIFKYIVKHVDGSRIKQAKWSHPGKAKRLGLLKATGNLD